jgi:rhodanese-related sulfurtransferase
MVRDVSSEELERGIEDGSLVLVDVREPHEFAAGHIPGSVSMPLSAFDPAELPREGRVVFSCAAGVRSRHAIGLAQSAGLDLCEHYAPGFKGWAASGLPVEVPGN